MLLEQKQFDTTAATEFYVFSTKTEVRAIHVCNTSENEIAYTIFYDEDSSGYSSSNAIFYKITLPAYSTDLIEYEPNSFVVGNSKNRLGVQINTASAVTVTMHGNKL